MSSPSSPPVCATGDEPPRIDGWLHTVYLVRHGQSTWNTQRRIQGQTPDVPLTTLGVTQAQRVAAALSGCGATALFSSDLLRAAQTADVLARALGLPVRRTPALREQALGGYEGQLAAEVSRAELDRVAGLGPDGRPGGGESLRDVYDRVGSFLADVAENPPEPSMPSTVLVSHGDTIRVACAWLQGLAPEDVPADVPANGSITTVELRTGTAARVQVAAPGG